MKLLVQKLCRATANNSSIAMIAQVILAIGSIIYFYSTENYQYIFYGIITGYVLMQLLHNMGLHKYFAHNSFKTNKFWHAVMSMTTPLACGGSPYGYAMAHRAHHIYSDTDKDPHGKSIGFLNISLFRWNLNKVPIRVMASLNEKWILRAHNYYLLIILSFYVTLLVVDYTWAMVYNIAGLTLYLSYLSINILDHRNISFGYRNFDTKDESKNDLFTGLLVGEWHNNHHKNPQKWNQRIRWWEFDASAQIIKLIESKN